jgi:hypothetical protein
MKIKKLNLQNAFRLAFVISKYVDLQELSPEKDALGFISDIVNKISPQEYLTCVSLMTEQDEETIKKTDSIDVLDAFFEGLKENQIITLVSFCKSLGL